MYATTWGALVRVPWLSKRCGPFVHRPDHPRRPVGSAAFDDRVAARFGSGAQDPGPNIRRAAFPAVHRTWLRRGDDPRKSPRPAGRFRRATLFFGMCRPRRKLLLGAGAILAAPAIVSLLEERARPPSRPTSRLINAHHHPGPVRSGWADNRRVAGKPAGSRPTLLGKLTVHRPRPTRSGRPSFVAARMGANPRHRHPARTFWFNLLLRQPDFAFQRVVCQSTKKSRRRSTNFVHRSTRGGQESATGGPPSKKNRGGT